MKRTVMKRIFCLVLAAVLLSVSLPSSAASDSGFGTPATGAETLSTDVLTLTVQPSGRFVLTDLTCGQRWISNPADETADKIAFGVNQERVASQVLISYAGKSVTTETATFAGCAAADGSYTELFRSGDTLTCVYHFEGPGFIIPVEYRLEGSRMITSVRTDRVEETSSNRLIDFTLNPFFGAGTVNENGYVLLPDGCGTTVRFNNGKTSDNRLELNVMYGDRSQVSEERPVTAQPVLLPAFGIAKQTAGKTATLFAAATEGYTGGKLTTNVAGRETGSNYGFFTFLFRESAVETMLDRTYAAKTRLIVAEKPQDTERFTLVYSFGADAAGGLSVMADNCRKLLFPDADDGKLTDLPLFLDLVMGVRVKKNFLGIPYKTLRALTTVPDAGRIVSELSAQGVPAFELRLRGMTSDGFVGGRITAKLKLDRKLGRLSDLRELQKRENVGVYPQVELTEFTKNGGGANRFFTAASDLLLDTVRLPRYTLASAVADKNAPDGRLLRPDRVKTAAQRLARDLTEKEIAGVCPASLAQGSYGDHGKSRGSGVAATAKVLNAALDTLAKDRTVMLEAPVFTAWGQTDRILYLPDDSSHYNLCDGTVPFLQMVLSGVIPYSSSAVNFSGEDGVAALRAVRCGAAPAFLLTDTDYAVLDRTDARDLYAACYGDCKEGILSVYGTVSGALGSVYGIRMTGFEEPQPGLTVSTYADGTRIAVNTAGKDLTLDGTTVSGGSYHVWKAVEAHE